MPVYAGPFRRQGLQVDALVQPGVGRAAKVKILTRGVGVVVVMRTDTVVFNEGCALVCHHSYGRLDRPFWFPGKVFCPF